MQNLVNWIGSSTVTPRFLVADTQRPFGFDMSIDGMQTQGFSVGIFVFLIIGIIVFTSIVFAFLTKGKGARLKKGEKLLFAWIFFGVVVSVAFGASQLLFGNLF
jgi:hypothetical protein